ncbi:MAG: hypothetical protein LBL81_00035 [Tannerella sp.]|jgi:hypothetical protein|nr:hypothetical protein [Tannerella sp.]
MNTLLDRIKLIANAEGIKITALELRIGASKGVLSRAISNGTDIQSKWIQLIVENYPNISPEWLLTGRGEMLKPKTGGENASASTGGNIGGNGNIINTGDNAIIHQDDDRAKFEALARERKGMIEDEGATMKSRIEAYEKYINKCYALLKWYIDLIDRKDVEIDGLRKDVRSWQEQYVSAKTNAETAVDGAIKKDTIAADLIRQHGELQKQVRELHDEINRLNRKIIEMLEGKGVSPVQKIKGCLATSPNQLC